MGRYNFRNLFQTRKTFKVLRVSKCLRSVNKSKDEEYNRCLLLVISRLQCIYLKELEFVIKLKTIYYLLMLTRIKVLHFLINCIIHVSNDNA